MLGKTDQNEKEQDWKVVFCRVKLLSAPKVSVASRRCESESLGRRTHFATRDMEVSPGRLSYCSDLSDGDLKSSFKEFFAPGIETEGQPSTDNELQVILAAPPLASELEKEILPVCGLQSHEEGILLIRQSLALGRNEPSWSPSEVSCSAPLWGGMDDWQHLRPFVQKHLAPHSAALPEDIVIVPATYFRDSEFEAPDAEESCVLVSGGVLNTFHEGATGGSHFMPLLPARCKKEYTVKPASSTKWRDMVMAVEGRLGEAFLEERVRDAGDCYFHSLLVALHFKGVVFQSAIFTHQECGTEAVVSCLPGAEKFTNQECGTPSSSMAEMVGKASPTTGDSLPSQTSPSQGMPDAVAPCHPRGLCFEDALAEEEVGDNVLQDPAEALEKKVREVSCVADLDRLLFPDRMFNDLKNKETVYEMVKANLKQAWEDTRTHRQLSRDEDFDVRLCTATPVAEAVHTLARAKGVATEALLGCVECNIGFLEAPGTTLTHNRRSNHFISPGSPIIVGSASSSRKSALIRMTDDWLTGAPAAAEEFADKSVLTTDCTTKGVRNCLKDHKRCGISTDEAANTFDTKFSDKESGIHFVSVTKLNTWTQAEFDGSATGHSKTSLDNYLFLLKAAGQTEVVEQIIHPKVHGFQKRLKQVWCLSEVHTHDAQQCQASEALVSGWHNWMHEKWASGKPLQLALEGRALTMYNSVKQAIVDFLAETKMPLVYKSKLMFWHGDILRDCHKVFRAVQYLQCMSGVDPAAAARVNMSLDEFTCALHKWICQVRTHFGSYRYAASKQEEAGAEGGRGVSAHAAVLCAAIDTSELADMSHDDLFMKNLIVRAPNNTWFTSADVRVWLKNKRGEHYKGNLSQKIDKAVTHLTDKGLLDLYEPDRGQGEDCQFTQRAAKRQGSAPVTGKATRMTKKRRLGEIQADDAAEQELRRLRLSANDFDA